MHADSQETPASAFSFDDLELLHRVANAVSSLDLDTLLQQVLEEMVVALDGDVGAVRLLEGEDPVLRAHVGYTDEQLKLIRRIKRQEGVGAELEKHGKPLIFTDPSDNPPNNPAPNTLSIWHDLKLRILVAVPLRVNGEFLGYILVAGRRKKHLEAVKLALLEEVGRQIGLAVERAHAHQVAQRHAANQRLLNQLALQIAGNVDGQAVFQEIVSALETLLGVQEATVYTVDPNQPNLRFRHGLIDVSQGLRPSTYQLGEGLIGSVAQTRQPVVVTNLSQSPLWKDFGLARQFHLTSFAGVPILDADELLGVLCVFATEERQFIQEDVDLLGDFARHAAMAIHNSSLLGELRMRAKRQEALQDAAAQLVRESGSEAVVQRIVEQAATLLEADRGMLGVCHWEDRELEIIAAVGDQTSEIGQRLPIDDSMGGEVVKRGVSGRFTQDEVKQKGYIARYRHRPPSQYTIISPLRIADRSMGALWLGRLAEMQPFTDDDIAVLETFGDYAASALNTTRLLNESRASTARVEQLIETAGNAIVVVDRDARVTAWNQAAELTFGYSTEEMLGAHVNTLWLPGDQVPPEAVAGVFAGQTIRNIETVRRRKDGSLTELLFTLSPVWGQEGEVVGAMGLYKDVSERRRIEAELQRRNDALLALQEIGGAITSTLDPQQVFQRIAERACELLNGLSCLLRLLSPDGAQLLPAAHTGRIEAPLNLPLPLAQSEFHGDVLRARRAKRFSWDEAQRLRGPQPFNRTTLPPLHFVIAPLLLDDEPLGTLFVGREIDHPEFDEADIALLDLFSTQAAIAIRNAREHAALEEAEAEYRELYDHAPVLYYSLDPQGMILNCNKTLADALGYTREELIGRLGLVSIIPRMREEARTVFKGILHGEGQAQFEIELLRRDGSTFPVETSVRAVRDAAGNFTRTDMILRDITERKQAETELRHSEERYRQMFERNQAIKLLVDP